MKGARGEPMRLEALVGVMVLVGVMGTLGAEVKPTFDGVRALWQEDADAVAFLADDTLFVEPSNKAEQYELYLKASYHQARGDVARADKASKSLMSMEMPAAAYDIRVRHLFETGALEELIKLPLFGAKEREKVDWETLLCGARAMDMVGQSKRADELFAYLTKVAGDKDQVAYFDVVRMLKRGDRDKAIERSEAFLKGTTLKARHAMFYQLEAAAYLQGSSIDLNKAMEKIDKSLELNPGSEKGWQTKVVLHEKLGQVDEAIKALKSLVGLVDDVGLRKTLVERLFRQGKFADAIVELEKVAEETPEHYFDLALLSWKGGDWKKALGKLGESLALNPRFRKSRMLKLEILIAKNERAQVSDLFREWLVADPENAEVVGTLLGLTGYGFSLTDLTSVLDGILQERPVDKLVLSVAGDVAAGARDYRKAVDWYNRLLKLVGGDRAIAARTMYRIGFCLNALGESDRAIKMAEQAIVQDAELAEAYNLLASIYAETQNLLEKALEFANKAIALNTSNVAFWDTKGLVLSKLGRFREASQALGQALQLDPNNRTLRNRVEGVAAALARSEAN